MGDRQEFAAVESGAKKEIRIAGGIRSGERICLRIASPVRGFALRVFLSSLFLKRRDIAFVADERDATLILTDASLDTVSAALLDSVLAGTTAAYLRHDDAVRVVSPFAALPDARLSAYARANGWTGPADDQPGETLQFLQTFSQTRPGTQYALKNVADKLSMIRRPE